MFAWVHDEVAIHSPILNITSAEPESGKTTTVNLTSVLHRAAWASVEISEPRYTGHPALAAKLCDRRV